MIGPPPVVEARHVTDAYGDHVVLEDVSLAIESGEFVGIIGPNGSGKTTLLKLLLGLRRPDEGEVFLFGEPAHRFDAGERLGYVSQQSTEADSSMPITVREAVTMGRYAHRGLGRLTATDRDRVRAALDDVGIADLADRRVGNLSGGQRQRVYIARAIASDADLLALDEPTVGVDATSRERFYGLLDTLHERGITIVLIEHDIEIIRDHVETVFCVNRGIHHRGPPDVVLREDTLRDVYGSEHRIPAPV